VGSLRGTSGLELTTSWPSRSKKLEKRLSDFIRGIHINDILPTLYGLALSANYKVTG
jgi:hypothetical protein